MSGPVGEDKGPYPSMTQADVDDSADGRTFVVAIPSLFFCEEIRALSFQDAAANIRISGYLDQKLEEVLGSMEPRQLFEGIEIMLIEPGNSTVAKVRLGLTVGWYEGGDTEAIVPLPPPGR